MKIQSSISSKIDYIKRPFLSKNFVFKLFLLFSATCIFLSYCLFLIYRGGKLQHANPEKFNDIYQITSDLIFNEFGKQRDRIFELFDTNDKNNPGKQIQIRIITNDLKQIAAPAELSDKVGKFNNIQATQVVFNRSELSPITQPANHQKVDLFTIDEQKKRIHIKSGDHKITESIVIPEGYTVISEAGTHIQLENSSNFISFSPLRFIGNQENPIKIFSEDLTGHGLVVIKASSALFSSNLQLETSTSDS